MTLTVYDSPAAFQRLRAEWNPLVRASAFDNLFMTWEWQTTWWQHLGTGQLCVLEVREGEELLGIVPLFREESAEGRQRLSLVGCVEVSDYLDIVARRGAEEQVLGAMLAFLQGSEAPPWDVLDFCNLPQGSPTHDLLPALAAAQGLPHQSAREDVCPVIHLPATWDDYLSSLSKKERHETRRKIRRLEREAAFGWHSIQAMDELPASMNAFIDLHRQSSDDKHHFMDDKMAAFFRAMAAVMLEKGWLWLSLLEIDQHPAAGLLCFDYGDRIWVYNSGFAPQFNHLSPGVVVKALCIQEAIQRGRAVFDFLQGAEPYKYRFGAVDTEVIRLMVLRTPASGRG
ncbi:MAG: GNAT family N-acetyltransferase [Chloroflexi bacterium]|nr:GNAT family N-acetyltransferase [Chloroflexota bacterium]